MEGQELVKRFREAVRELPLWGELPEGYLEDAEEALRTRGGLEGLREAAKEVLRGMEAVAGEGAWLTAHALDTVGRSGSPEEVFGQLTWYGEAYALLQEAAGLGRVAQEGVERAVHEGDLDLAQEILEFTGRLREVVEGFPLGAQVPEDRLERAEERIVASRGGLEGLREAAKEVVRGLEASSGGTPLASHALEDLDRGGSPEEVLERLERWGRAYALFREAGEEVREHVERALRQGRPELALERLAGSPEPGA